MNDKFSNGIGIFCITLIALYIIIFHNAKVKCEKSGGVLANERIGKSYRLECVKN